MHRAVNGFRVRDCTEASPDVIVPVRRNRIPSIK
jgi:hypothetical protein